MKYSKIEVELFARVKELEGMIDVPTQEKLQTLRRTNILYSGYINKCVRLLDAADVDDKEFVDTLRRINNPKSPEVAKSG